MVRWGRFEFEQGLTDYAKNAQKLDSLAFSLVVYLAVRSGQNGRKIPTLLRTIAGDAAWYFLVIFSAHLTFVLTLNLARVSATVVPSELQPNAFNPSCRSHYNSFQPRK